MLTVMTWNAENFFVPAVGHEADYAAKVDALTAVINAAAPDLLRFAGSR
jgi:hypothetical protein